MTQQTIFDFRLNSARSNLNDLRTFVASIRKRNEHLYDLHLALVRDDQKIAGALGRLGNYVKQAEEKIGSTFGYTINDVGEDINKIAKDLKLLSTQIDVLKNHAVEISVLELDVTVLSLKNVLGLRDNEFGEKIGKGTENLDKISRTAAKAALNPATPSVPAKHWSDLRAESRDWVQFLDYLAGVSLRHDGLADKVCFITDGLIWELQGSSREPSALAIPGREGCAGVLPRVVYLRFPEWTVWALPLAAHEFWHILQPSSYVKAGFQRRVENTLDGDEPVRNTPYWRMKDQKRFENEDDAALNKRLAEGSNLDSCLADAFATFTMGPAYAYSAIFLMIDPLVDTDQYRAQSILRALKRLDEMGGQLTPFNEIHNKLSQLWVEASKEAGTSLKELPQDLARWIDCLLEYLASMQKISFPPKQNPKHISLVAECLKTGNCEIETTGLELRVALTEAWKARITPPENMSPERTAQLAKHCEKLCKKIIMDWVNQRPEPRKEFLNMI